MSSIESFKSLCKRIAVSATGIFRQSQWWITQAVVWTPEILGSNPAKYLATEELYNNNSKVSWYFKWKGWLWWILLYFKILNGNPICKLLLSIMYTWKKYFPFLITWSQIILASLLMETGLLHEHFGNFSTWGECRGEHASWLHVRGLQTTWGEIETKIGMKWC